MDLPILLECLQVFGAAALQNTMLTMAYEVRARCDVRGPRGWGGVGGVFSRTFHVPVHGVSVACILRRLNPLMMYIPICTHTYKRIQPGRGVLRLTLEEQGTSVLACKKSVCVSVVRQIGKVDHRPIPQHHGHRRRRQGC